MTTESQNSSRTTDWILFFVSLVVCILMLIFLNEWFWVALPFVLTYLVKALDVM